MARIAGINLPLKKRIVAALPYLYGVGPSAAVKILAHPEVTVDPNKRTEDLSDVEVNRIRQFVDKNYKVEGALRQEVILNIKRKKEIGSYQGVRHMRGLPVRGQRTKTNSRTRHGNVRKTAGSGKKKSSDKT